jgi:hypothetical protein
LNNSESEGVSPITVALPVSLVPETHLAASSGGQSSSGIPTATADRRPPTADGHPAIFNFQCPAADQELSPKSNLWGMMLPGYP